MYSKIIKLNWFVADARALHAVLVFVAKNKVTHGAAYHRGVLPVYMTGRSDVFFWVENLHPRYFLGQVICHVLFWVLKSVWLSKSVLRYLVLPFFE